MSNKVALEFSGRFKKNVTKLAKKYRRIRKDLAPVLDELQIGKTPGDHVPSVKGYRVYKARVRNSDVGRGKSGSYRIIHYLITSDMVVLLTIYAKSEQTDMSANEIVSIIDEYDF